jgi:hypothetical protein
MEKEKLQEAYEAVMLNEANEETQIAKALEKIFGVKVQKVEVRREIEIRFRPLIDQEEFENFDKIDAFEEFVEKKLKKKGISPFVEWKGLTYVTIKEI